MDGWLYYQIVYAYVGGPFLLGQTGELLSPKSSSKKFIERQRNLFFITTDETVNNQIKQCFTINMEDSLELPEDYDDFQIQTLLSPAPHNPDSKHTTPPHSLAYSNSTCAKDKLREIHIRSPLDFEDSPARMGLIKNNNENYPLNQQKTVPISPQKNEESPQHTLAVKSQYRKVQPRKKDNEKSPPKTSKPSPQSTLPQKRSSPSPTPFQQRKTIDKTSSLTKRIRELQQALHMQTVISQQLRTKLSVTNSLLESKMKEQGLGYLFSMKNSSRDMKNVDIFLELTNLQKSVVEKNIFNDRLKNQIKELQIENQKIKGKKQGSPIIVRSPNKTINDELEKLLEEKQSLMSYIDEQKATLKRKLEYISELEQQINRISDKQTHYTEVQRPKLINEMGQLKLLTRDLNEQLQRLRMQMNLIEIKASEDVQQLDAKLKRAQQTLISQQSLISEFKEKQIISQSKTCKSIQIQKEDSEFQILKKQMIFLKTQRDYYLAQYRKRCQQSALLYSLQLKISTLQELPTP